MQDLLYKVVDIATNASKIIMMYYNNLNDKEITIKSDNTPLTRADLESNNFIMNELAKINSYKICSEEEILNYEERKNLKYYWLLDPLDGTKDFIAKNGNFAINIALIYNNHPILGVIHAPALEEVYFALQDYGAFNLKIKSKIQTKLLGNKKSNNSKIIACGSMFHNNDATLNFAKKNNLQMIKKGSSLKFCSIADGSADIYPRFNGSKEWDTAAGDIIVRESGGVVIDYKTKKQMVYNKENIKNNYFIAFSKNQIEGDIYNKLMKKGAQFN